MSLEWFSVVVLFSCNFLYVLAVPAQKYSPGIPITPTANQTPGQVTGIIGESSVSSTKVTAQTLEQQAEPAPVVIRTPVPQRQTVYLQSNSPYYSTPQYAGQQPTAYVYPDGTYASVSSQPTATRIGGNYYSSQNSNYARPGSLGSLLTSSNPVASLLGYNSGYSGTRLTPGQTLGALGALGTAGVLGAGALGAGALLLG